MQKTEDQTLVVQLKELFEAEREAILDSNLDKVEQLVARKENLAAQISGLQDGVGHEVQDLRKIALRNQELLDSALEGIRFVADRVREIRRARAQLDTYNNRGERETHVSAQPSVERRA